MAEVVIVPSPAAAGVLVADEIFSLVTARPDAVLGLATGSTPMPVYEALAASKEGREFARQVFAQARPGYHPITTASVEAALADRKK